MTTSTLIPDSPTGSRFGWPKPARIEEFKKLVSSSSETTRLEFQGRLQSFPIIRVSIDLPKYRMANGRTASMQAEYLAKNRGVRRDLFSGDSELWDAQEAQHRLLLQLGKQADLRAYFEDTVRKQVDPILVDENGFVVNGNRRLATWRELLHEDGVKYGHFRHIDVAILPHCEEREIDRLEASLQIEKDIKADYSWDAEANMMLAKQKRDGFSNRDLADLYKMKESEVEELLDMRSYAEEYLTSRGKKDHWSLVADREYAFRKIAQLRQKVAGIGRQEVFKHAAFTLIDNPEEAGGRLYDAIPAIMEDLDVVISKLRQQFVVEAESFQDNSLDDFFGGGGSSETQAEDAMSVPLAKEIQKAENADSARKIIVEVIESQKQLKKDSKDAGYLLDCCSKSQAALMAAVAKGLRPESKREGVENQLDQIESLVGTIRDWLGGRRAGD
jgi:hypothetical protein